MRYIPRTVDVLHYEWHHCIHEIHPTALSQARQPQADLTFNFHACALRLEDGAIGAHLARLIASHVTCLRRVQKREARRSTRPSHSPRVPTPCHIPLTLYNATGHLTSHLLRPCNGSDHVVARSSWWRIHQACDRRRGGRVWR